MPRRCPYTEGKSDSCRLRVVRYRDRKTGPCHPLLILKCRSHPGPSFTVYPPGYGPYIRRRYAPVDPGGEIVCTEKLSGATQVSAAWESTFVTAAIDASCGERWSRESPSDDPRRRRTQDRYIGLSALFFGLSSLLTEEVAQQVAFVLGVAYLRLVELRRRYETASTYAEKGAVVVRVVSFLHVDGTLSDRLRQSGELAGVWEMSRRWDPG
jgi:hypothetical protein